MHCIIAGCGEGLGKALGEKVLEEGFSVSGLSRKQSIIHPRYKHTNADLSIPGNLAGLLEEPCSSAKGQQGITFVYNAGVVRPIGRMGTLSSAELISAYQVNLVSASVLANEFLRLVKPQGRPMHIVFVGSGAAFHPTIGWSSYCSGKAGLAMLASVIREENPEMSTFLVDPGLIDTEMQADLRKEAKDSFPQVDKFIGFQKDGKLNSPEVVAAKLAYLIKNPGTFDKLLVKLSEISEA